MATALAVGSGLFWTLTYEMVFYLLVTGSLATSVVLWRGVLHDPVAVRSGVSFFRLGLTIACLVAIYAFCMRDLVHKQRAEEGV